MLSIVPGVRTGPSGNRTGHELLQHLFAQHEGGIEGIEHAVGYRFAQGQAGGDIADVFRFNSGEIAFSIADISGKGVHAAVQAAMVKFALRAYLALHRSPARALADLDALFCENNEFEETDHFASVFVGVVDRDRRAMTYACAGHEPVFIVHRGERAEVLAPTGSLIGMCCDAEFAELRVGLSAGSIFVAATDGITEARRAGEFYGMERLAQVISMHAHRNVGAQLRAILADVAAYRNAPPHDDIAVLLARML